MEQVKLFFQHHKFKKQRRRLYLLLTVFLILIGIFSYLTNPFVKFSITIDPHAQVNLEDSQIKINYDGSLILQDEAFFKNLAKLKSSWHIVSSKFSGSHKASTSSVDEIIQEIHQLRFDPNEPYLISGDHFSVLYPRSLGIFYHSLLDQRTALDAQDWQNRQVIYLKTLAYALEVYNQTDQLSTTIVPVGPRSVALMNIYAQPSDTLYSLLFALQQLQDNSYQTDQYPFEVADQQYQLETTMVAQDLQQNYLPAIQKHYHNYFDMVYDPNSGLVKKDILLSGTKDMMKKESGFYDNVMLYQTVKLAQDLQIVEPDEQFLIDLKERIISNFWLEEKGFFLEDLSPESIEKEWYSSDWLIAYQTGFLNINNDRDREILLKAVSYIRKNAIDQPFPIQYHSDERRNRLYGVVRYVAPKYGSTTIWSNWGMEYTKLLIHLSQVTGQESYLLLAEKHLDSYAFNIKRYKGYPELYNEQGDFFRTLLYKSIRQTGWVVTYEQARAMFEWTRDNWGK